MSPSIDYTLSGFDESDKPIIRHAMPRVVDLFYSPRWWRVLDGRTWPLYYLADAALSRSGLTNTPDTCRGLMLYQIRSLAASRFPLVNIVGFHDADTVKMADAPDSIPVIVKAIVDSDGTVSRGVPQGEFHLRINQWHLQRYWGPVVWASVIAHELLENLGHRHDPHDYSNAYQINAYSNQLLPAGHPLIFRRSA